ncbi:cytochrome b5 [Phtheirospermum japonicum]|uniref:Cytochrome b5 n=1 Tax=Phtheirospermum japonicum TaxID=374723 RepID=A0A830BMV3_9LAMI|nr:cytochrome b5 [Phtheirospermum japonicum]
MAQKVHAFEEVEKHNKKDNCWLIISGKMFCVFGSIAPLIFVDRSFYEYERQVYDVTPFLDNHPGGEEVMLISTGKDATSDFEDVGHSDGALEKMKELYIGEIDASTLPLKEQSTAWTASSSANGDSSDLFKIFIYILPLFILGAAFLMHYYSNQE